MKIIKKVIKNECYICNGLGVTALVNGENPICRRCEGTGVYEKTSYYHIKNFICIDGDTLK